MTFGINYPGSNADLHGTGGWRPPIKPGGDRIPGLSAPPLGARRRTACAGSSDGLRYRQRSSRSNCGRLQDRDTSLTSGAHPAPAGFRPEPTPVTVGAQPSASTGLLMAEVPILGSVNPRTTIPRAYLDVISDRQWDRAWL